MKVLPKDDNVRKILYHPTGGKFRAEGPADWPDDTFTARRLRDGDITKEEDVKKEHEVQAKPAHEKEPEVHHEDPEKSSPSRRR
jgi:hypothetical protein